MRLPPRRVPADNEKMGVLDKIQGLAHGFIGGAPLAPNTPYDLFSSAPRVPGVAGIGTLLTTAIYATHAFDFSLKPAFGYVRGSVTNASYWGRQLAADAQSASRFASASLRDRVSNARRPRRWDGDSAFAVISESLRQPTGTWRFTAVTST